MGFEHDVGFRRTRGWVPQDWVVVREEGEEDAEGKTCSWSRTLDSIRGKGTGSE